MDKAKSVKLKLNKSKTVAIIVAHPDDETLWAGGTILRNPAWHLFIVCMCRSNDSERATNFYNALRVYNAKGIMGDLDDGPEQIALDENEVANTILKLLPPDHFDLIITHNPSGEYTRHLRHEEISKAVIELWKDNKISTKQLWTFAYTDGNKKHYPISSEKASIYKSLTKRIWLKKYAIITETYGFTKDSWEAKTTTKTESFWKFTDPNDAHKWINNGGMLE
jgi:LmbE family N-acetylglucosaminyl deacetylase